jgi:hypothetical protein
MAGAEVFLASPIEWTVRATGTNATVTASKAAPGVGFRNYCFGVSFSCSAAPLSPVEVQLRKDSGGTILDGWEIPASAIAPIVVNYLTHPMEGSDNGDMDITIPSLGAGVTSVAVLKGTTRARG